MKDKNNCSQYTVLIPGTWRMKGHKKLYTFTLEQYKDVKNTYILHLTDPEESKNNASISYKIYSENESCFILLSDIKKFEMIKIDLLIETPEMTMKNEYNEIFTYFKCKGIAV